MSRMVLLLVLLVVGLSPAWGDIACDGLDDDLRSGLTMGNFLSASTGSIHFWYKPTGLPNSNDGSTECYAGGFVLGSYESGVGIWSSVTRHENYEGMDQFTGFHWDGAANCTSSPYAVNTWTSLAWVLDGGTLTFYKDGLLVDSTSAGPTASLAGHFHLCGGLAFEQQGFALSQGTITGVELFAAALSPAEIRAKAQARLHRFSATARSGAWTLDECATMGNGVSFFDHSGNARHLTGHDGPNNTGLTCLGNTVLSYPWGAE